MSWARGSQTKPFDALAKDVAQRSRRSRPHAGSASGSARQRSSVRRPPISRDIASDGSMCANARSLNAYPYRTNPFALHAPRIIAPLGLAVEMPVTGRPPHRSVRAGFPHTAPTWVANGKAVARPGMKGAGRRQPRVRQSRHANLRHPVALTATSQDAPPKLDDVVSKRSQRTGRDRRQPRATR